MKITIETERGEPEPRQVAEPTDAQFATQVLAAWMRPQRRDVRQAAKAYSDAPTQERMFRSG